jgi:tetratricopeptide (TPR) repeat protein
LQERYDLIQLTLERLDTQLETFFNTLNQLFVIAGLLFAGIAAITAWRQFRHEQRLQTFTAQSAETMSKILTVVHGMLDLRFTTESAQATQIAKLQGTVDAVTNDVARLTAAIQAQRQDLERRARTLVETPRHGFKDLAQLLGGFAKDFDAFDRFYPQEPRLTGRALYIRGVAAAFHDDFEALQRSLTAVTTLPKENDEEDTAYAKRRANAYFYLALNKANLGNFDEALELFGEARKPRIADDDYLIRLAVAETRVMARQYDQAELLLDEVLAGLLQTQRLRSHQLRLLSRAHLMRGNIAILRDSTAGPQRALPHVEKAHDHDSEYYYAAFTLSQIKFAMGDQAATEAAQHFADAYSCILRSGDLRTVVETRARILLLMVAALSGKYGRGENERTIDKYLDDAETLSRRLPSVETTTAAKPSRQYCTVFSPLSKVNVDPETIRQDIIRIREGRWSLHQLAAPGVPPIKPKPEGQEDVHGVRGAVNVDPGPQGLPDHV